MKRAVITGIGAVTPLGNDIESTWSNLANKTSGIAAISKFDPSGLPSQIAGELKQFSPEDYIPKKDILRLDPFVQYAAAAALMAAEDAGLISSQPSGITCDSVLDSAGIIIGSSRGGILSMENALERHIMKGRPFSPYLMSSSTINMASSFISMQLGTKGIALGISTACASGTNAIGEAFRMIQHGLHLPEVLRRRSAGWRLEAMVHRGPFQGETMNLKRRAGRLTVTGTVLSSLKVQRF
jgi:3-oxoacyl-(acyl-carrier-protein) synthase